MAFDSKETGDEYQDYPWEGSPNESNLDDDFEQGLMVDLVEEFDAFLYVHKVNLNNPEPHDDCEDEHIIYGSDLDDLVSGLHGVLKQYGIVN